MGKTNKSGKTTKKPSSFIKNVENEEKKVVFSGNKSISDLAREMNMGASAIMKYFLLEGKMVNINTSLDLNMTELVCMNFGYDVIVEETQEYLEQAEETNDDNSIARPPIVTIMGHVDHGKTTLLDAIRKSRVVDGEFGGITQNIGAYQVDIKGKKITFLDTPGHEAFASMRARGAQITDIVIIVVAADDGVMPQTKEAIDHAKAAGVPIVVAINKIDKPNVNFERLYSELSELQIVSEEWGGENIFCKVSAKFLQGIDSLLESILLVAELEEYKANPERKATGTVIEAKLEKGRGTVASLIVQNGTLKVGDTIVAGAVFGSVRQMKNDLVKTIKEALPSTPVEITGLSEVPAAGDKFKVYDNEKEAKNVVARRLSDKTIYERGANNSISLEELNNQMKLGNMQTLNIIIKADSDGSSEAVKSSLLALSNDEVRVNVIRSQAGAITESDVLLATASNAIIYGFNVRPDNVVKMKADEQKVDIRLHKIIYALVEEIETAMKGMLKPTYKEVVTGSAEVRQIYKVSKVGTIAGCYVTNGSIKKDCGIRVIRNDNVVFEGKLSSLKRFSNDSKEVSNGYECGITIENYNDIRENDVIEGFIMEEVKR